MTATEKLWTIRDVADYLHCHTDTIKDRIARGVLRAINVGTNLRATYVVRQGDLDAFLAARTTIPNPHTPRRRPPDSRELEQLLKK